MYEVSAAINDIEVRRANLTIDFQLDLTAVREQADGNTKLVFICSPNNPTGNCIDREKIFNLAENFQGMIVVDEAYIHFSNSPSLVSAIKTFPNLVVLQTFSKAWGLAGLRVGVAFAHNGLIAYFNKIKPPYNVSRAAQNLLLSALIDNPKLNETIRRTVDQRQRLVQALSEFSFVRNVYPSDANFLLVRCEKPVETRKYLLERNIIVRDRSTVELCEGCLRVTVGTPDENDALDEYIKRI